MEVDRAIDITAEERGVVLELLEQYLPGTPAWAYGSRVQWTSRPQSDLDLVVFATPEQGSRVGTLREAFEESNLPFRVDLFVWDAVPEAFRQQIEAEHVVLRQQEKQYATDGWSETKLGDVIEFKRGYDLPKYKRTPGPVPVVSSSGSTDYHLESKVQGPGVVTGRYGTLGRVFFIQRDFWPLNTTLYVRDFKGNDPRFIAYLLQGLDFSPYSDKAAVPGLNRNHLHENIVRIPTDISEQRAIAHILGTLDDKIELNRRMNKTLEAMAKALFKSWFVDFDPVRAKMEDRHPGLPQRIADLFPGRLVDSEIGQIPDGWNAGSLRDLASLNPESWSVNNRPEEIAYVDIKNTKWGYIERVETLLWHEAPTRARRVLRKRDTIMTTVRPGNGSYALIDEDGLTGSTGFAVLRPQRQTDRAFVWCAATSSENIDRLTNLADGGAYPAVGPHFVASTPAVLADSYTREAFSRLADPLLDKIEANKRESQYLATLRDGLLPKLISGEIRVDGKMSVDVRA